MRKNSGIVKKRNICKKPGRKQVLRCAVMTVFIMSAMCMPVFADTSKVTTGIETLKTLFFSIIAGMGAIIAGKGIMETAQGYQQADTSSMNSGIKQIIAGGLMAAVSTLVGWFV